MTIALKPNGTLLSLGDYYGSLAAARSLGSLGVPVFFADHRFLTAGSFSRHVAKRLRSPPLTDLESYGKWLENVGCEHPGMFLYPTSDDMAFLIASKAKILEKYFILYQPSLDAVMSLLDKSQLALKAKIVGLKMPQSFSNSSIQDLIYQIDDFAGPLLVKPKTQVGLLTKGKGIYCANKNEVSKAIKDFINYETYQLSILNYDPLLRFPILQAYHPSAVQGMLSIAGFVARDKKTAFFLASKKVFQRPRKLGVGIGFSACSVPADLQAKLLELCTSTGYFGVFEAEFVEDTSTGENLLVDFNPRYYGQMAFEIARGLDLPKLAYLDAIQSHEEFRLETERTKHALMQPQATESRYALGWVLALMIRTQRLGGQMTKEEYQQWSSWLHGSKAPYYDALASDKDPLPETIDQALLLKHALRHPRDFYRKFFK